MNVSQEVIELLDAGRCVGQSFALQGQIDRKAYTNVNKVLIAAGGKWNRGAKAHLFSCDAQDAISDIILTGKVVDAKREFDFFETPPELAQRVIELADIQSHHEVLEPNAGGGMLSVPAAKISNNVDVIEIQPELAQDARSVGIYRNVIEGDFLKTETPLFDRIVMNPPFGKQADIHHVNKAITHLKPGGKLVAIMSAGVEFRSNKLTTDFRETVENMGGTIDRLPSASFKASGTNVETVLVTITKAG